MAGRRARSTWAHGSRWACVLGVALALAGWAAPSASAQLSDASLAPSTGPTGTAVTVAGGDCRKRGPDASVVHVVAASLGVDLSVPTAANGTWTATFVVPPSAGLGPHVVTASCVRTPAAEPYLPMTLIVSPPESVPTTAAPETPSTASTVAPPTAVSPTLAPGLPGSAAPATGETAARAPDSPSTPSTSAATEEPTTTLAERATDPSGAPSVARRSGPGPGGDNGDESSSSSKQYLVAILLGTTLAIVVGAVLARRHVRRDEVEVAASPAVAPDTASAIGSSPEAEDPDASPPPPSVAPRSAHQVSDVAHTMAVLEPVLRASAPPPVVFSVDATTDEVMAAVGPRELELVVAPLVNRAAASVADGGTIRVVVGRGPCSASRDAEWALVVVADNGPGAAGEADPSARPDLDSVRDAVAALGGHLDVTSVARHGTTVTVALPLVETTEPGEMADDDGAVTSR